MTARPPRQKRRPPTRQAMQRALKAGMANLAERITSNIFFLFALGVIGAGIWMWPTEDARLVANMFIVIGIIAAIFARSIGP